MIEDLPKRPRDFSPEGRAFTVEQMRFLASHPSIQFLSFKDCPIGDEHVRELAALTGLKKLDLEGTRVTDAALAVPAGFPKLFSLMLTRTAVTGEGLRHLRGHPSLKWLGLRGTNLSDETARLLIDVPKLETVYLDDTKLTVAGMMALAAHPRLQAYAGSLLNKPQVAEFEAEQRRLARERKGSSAAVPAEDAEAAKAVLLSFFKAMVEWQIEAGKSYGRNRGADDPALRAHCEAIFEAHCTARERRDERPHSLHFGTPPDYRAEKIVEVEPAKGGGLLIYTKEKRPVDQQRRYVMERVDGQWRIDRRQVKYGGWERDLM